MAAIPILINILVMALAGAAVVSATVSGTGDPVVVAEAASQAPACCYFVIF